MRHDTQCYRAPGVQAVHVTGGFCAASFVNGLFSLANKLTYINDPCGTTEFPPRCPRPFSGLCLRAHWAHIMSAALAALDISGAREVYNTLRDVYNRSRPLGSSPVPPLDEWQGMSAICEDTYCRYV